MIMLCTYDGLEQFDFQDGGFAQDGKGRAPEDGPELGEPSGLVRRRASDFGVVDVEQVRRRGHGPIGFHQIHHALAVVRHVETVADFHDLFLGIQFLARHVGQRVDVEVGRIEIRRTRQTLNQSHHFIFFIKSKPTLVLLSTLIYILHTGNIALHFESFSHRDQFSEGSKDRLRTSDHVQGQLLHQSHHQTSSN